MSELQQKIHDLEFTVADFKKELRRVKTTVNKVEKLGLIPPTELLIKKENLQVQLKEFKEELKIYKKIAEIIK